MASLFSERPKGIQYFHPESLFNKKIALNALINKIETNNIVLNITGTTTFELAASDNQVIFYFGCVDFSQHLRTYYEYQLQDADNGWIEIADQNSVRYNALPPGKYIFKVRISNNNRNWQNADNEVTIIIATPVYKSWWFRLLGALLILVIIASVINHFRKRQIQKVKAEQDKKRASLELWENKQKATESRLQSLRLQMNPHFLFNALNSIQQMILANEEMVATRYLSRFSKLLRTVLIHSDKESISLREEIEAEELRIPTLLIQPFVENAIWHGLMHKEGNRHLSIRFNETDDFLQCVIEDNGVGRKKSQEQKNLHGLKNTHTGKGISVSEERVKTLKGVSGKTGNILINT